MSKPPKNKYSAVVHVEMLWHDDCWRNLKQFVSENRMTLCMICDDNFPTEVYCPISLAPQAAYRNRISTLYAFPKVEIGGHSHALFPSTHSKHLDISIKLNFESIKKVCHLDIDHFVPGHWIYNQTILDRCQALGYKYFHVAVPPRPEMNFHDMIPLINGVDLPRAIHDYELYGYRDSLRKGVI